MPQSKSQNAKVVFVVGISFLLGSCKQTVPPKIETTPTVSVEELLANPQGYAHTLVKVSGCFVLGLESVTLRPCSASEPGDAIWVEDDSLRKCKSTGFPTCRMRYRRDWKSPQLRKNCSLTTRGAMRRHGENSNPHRTQSRPC
jgi:hypothetical protein